MKNSGDGKVIIGESKIKCKKCGCETLSTPMPVGKITYMPGRSVIAGQPDIQIADAEMAFICTGCGAFVFLHERPEEKKAEDRNEHNRAAGSL